MTYNDVEPHPDPDDYRVPLRYMMASLIVGVTVSWLNVPFRTPWFFLAYFPFAVTLPASVILLTIRHRRFMRDSDAWAERMYAYYDAKVRP